MKKLILLFTGIAALTAVFFLYSTSENQPTKINSFDEMPAPTNGQTEVYDGQTEGEGNPREDYEAAIHFAGEGVDWQQIDFENKLNFYQQKKAAKSSNTENSNTYANGNLTGSWSERGSNNQAGNMAQIEYSANGDVLYGISGGGTIWRGNLNGTGWTPQNDDLQFEKLFLETAATGNGGTNLLASMNKRVWYSADEGVNWAQSNGIVLYDNWGEARDLVTTTTSVYFLVKAWNTTTWSAVIRLYHSADGGVNFTEIFSVPTGSSERVDLWSSENSSKAYLISEGANLYELDGTNVSLLNVNNDLPTANATVLTGTDTGNGVVFYTLVNRNTVYKSTDNGANWTQTGTTPVNAWGVGMTASATDPTKLYIGAVECYRSYDSGATWTSVNGWGAYYGNNDYLHADIMDFKHGEKADGTDFILVGNHGGLHISYNDLQTTTNLGTEGLNIAQYYDACTDPTSVDYIYAGSQDQGHQRTSMGSGTGIADFDQVISGDYGSSAFSENGTRFWTVYPGATIHYYPFPKTQGKLAQYSISGNHEAANDWIIPTAPVADPAENAIFIAGGNINGGDGSYLVKLTATSQAPWSISAFQYNYDFRANSNSGTATISAINASTVDANRLYVGMSDGSFFYSNDNGTSWTKTAGFSGPSQAWIATMAVYSSKINSNEVWFAGNGYASPAVYKSTDGGQTFTAASNGLPNTLVRDITANSDESLFFAATDVGPFVYVAAENTWYDMMGVEAPQQAYYSVEYVPTIATVRFATYGRGIWDFVMDCTQSIYYADTDEDGFGDPNNTILACSLPQGYTTDNSDCDDSNAIVYPNAAEICDGIDNDCDGQIDEGFTVSCGDYCPPSHWGSQNELITNVTLHTINNTSGGWTSGTGYSDFTNISTDLNPNATYTITVSTNYGWDGSKMGIWIDWNKNIVFDTNEEIAIFSGNGPHTTSFTVPANAFNGPTRLRVHYQYGPNYQPNACGGSGYSGGETEDYTVNIINCSMTTFYADDDGDGFGDLNNSTQACSQPAGYVANNSDCDDNDATVHPNASEICDGIDNDCNGQIDEVNCSTAVVMETGVLNAVGESWQTVSLQNTYTSPVVVATYELPSKNDPTVVTRIRNANSTSFQIKLQSTGPNFNGTYQVHYMVVEEGTYTTAANGIKMEAKKVISTETARKNSWVTETQTYANAYNNPVVIGQVMTENDPNWSVFWACGNSQSDSPSATAFKAGKHVGEDPNITRNNETIAYIVLESGSYTVGNLTLETALGADLVKGPNNSGYNYNISTANPQGAVLSAAGIDGGDGGLPVLYKSAPLTNGLMTMAFAEDQSLDSERNHTHEQVAYIVFGQYSANLVDNNGAAPNINNQANAARTANLNLNVFPNPAQKQVVVAANFSTNNAAQIFITDLSGKVVITKNDLPVFDNYLKMEIDISQLQNGIYFVVAMSGEERIVQRLVKVE